LILRRRRHVTLHREMAQERRDLGRSHLRRMPLTVEEDEAPDPVDVRLLGPRAAVAQPKRDPDPIEQARLRALAWTARRRRRRQGRRRQVRGRGVPFRASAEVRVRSFTRATSRAARAGSRHRGELESHGTAAAYQVVRQLANAANRAQSNSTIRGNTLPEWGETSRSSCLIGSVCSSDNDCEQAVEDLLGGEK
jgi:hypothetical protein